MLPDGADINSGLIADAVGDLRHNHSAQGRPVAWKGVLDSGCDYFGLRFVSVGGGKVYLRAHLSCTQEKARQVSVRCKNQAGGSECGRSKI